MNTFQNITHYNNHLSDKLNSIESFFTEFVIDSLKAVPLNYVKRWHFEVPRSGYMSVQQSFSFEDGKLEDVTIALTLLYSTSGDSHSFIDFCEVEVVLGKDAWYDPGYIERVTYKLLDFPTNLIPMNIISHFEPIFSMPFIFIDIENINKCIEHLTNASNYVDDSETLKDIIIDLRLKLKDLKLMTSNYPNDYNLA